MKSVNALTVRRSLGAVLQEMEKKNQPVLVTRDREPVAALVPIHLFRQRFVDWLGQEALEQAIGELEELRSPSDGRSLDVLRQLRGVRGPDAKTPSAVDVGAMRI